MAIRLRPRFRVTVPLPLTEIPARFQRIVDAPDAPDAPIAGTVLREFIVLRVRPEAQHFWSPELTLQLSEEPEGHTLIRALFGPRPAVWTGFAGFYTFALFISLMALLFGLAQWSLGIHPLGLWLLPIPLVLLASAYAIALTGQRLGHDQMVMLRQVFDEALEQPPTAPS